MPRGIRSTGRSETFKWQPVCHPSSIKGKSKVVKTRRPSHKCYSNRPITLNNITKAVAVMRHTYINITQQDQKFLNCKLPPTQPTKQHSLVIQTCCLWSVFNEIHGTYISEPTQVRHFATIYLYLQQIARFSGEGKIARNTFGKGLYVGLLHVWVKIYTRLAILFALYGYLITVFIFGAVRKWSIFLGNILTVCLSVDRLQLLTWSVRYVDND